MNAHKTKNYTSFLRERQHFPPQSLRAKNASMKKDKIPIQNAWSNEREQDGFRVYCLSGRRSDVARTSGEWKSQEDDSFGSNGCWCLNLHQDVGNKKGTDFSDQSVWNEKSRMPRLFLLSQLESWRQEFYTLPVVLPKQACRSSCFKNSMATRRFECCLASLFDMGWGIKYVFMVTM